jgi:hypothetical protein
MHEAGWGGMPVMPGGGESKRITPGDQGGREESDRMMGNAVALRDILGYCVARNVKCRLMAEP